MSELIQTYGPIFVDGFKITLFSSVLALVFSLIIGTLMAIFQLSKNKVVSALAKAYVEFFRNIPLLIIVMFFYVVVPIYWFNLDGFQAGTIGLTIYTSAFIGEAIRSGILAVPKGQMEASRSLGMTYTRTMQKIILPQAIKIMIPSFVNQFVISLKDTTIISVIGVVELLQTGKIIVARTTQSTYVYLIIAIIYLVVITALTKLAKVLEKKVK